MYFNLDIEIIVATDRFNTRVEQIPVLECAVEIADIAEIANIADILQK